MSTLKVDTIRPVTTDGSLTLQGDSSGSGVTGITIDSNGIPDFPNGLTLNDSTTLNGVASTSEINGTHTTGSVTSGTTALTVASGTGISTGDYVTGEGITPGTTVSAISGTSVTLSANANVTLSSDPVSFYPATKVLTAGNVAGQLCRAWVNFYGGPDTPYIRASGNVSSITDNGTGDYTVNFTTAMPDANYVTLCTSGYPYNTGRQLATAQATTSVRIESTNTSFSVGSDSGEFHVGIFR